jgi:PAS domain S-box-containing protein
MSVDTHEPILIVEESPGLAEREQRRLERAGFAVVRTEAENALEHLRRSRVGLLVLGSQSPDGNPALDFQAELQAHGIDVPAILVANDNEALRMRALHTGVRGFVPRSSECLDRLLEAVERVMRQVRLERRLAEAEAQLHSILESARDAIILTGADQRITLFNRAAQTIFRCPAAAAIGEPVTRFIPAEALLPPPGHRSAGVRVDGERLFMEVSVSRSDVGGKTFSTFIVRDVTECEQIAESQRRSEDRFTLFMRHLPGLAWIKDRRGCYVYANAATEQCCGVSGPQLWSKTDDDLFPPETARQFKENDQRALTGGTEVRTIEILRYPDESIHDFLVSKFPISGPDGAPKWTGGIAIDITDRERAEQALRESEAFLRMSQRIGKVGSWEWNLETNRVKWSDEMSRIHGLEPDAFDGTLETAASFFHPGDLPQFQEGARRLLEQGEFSPMEYRIRRRDGSERYLWCTGEVVLDPAGKPIRSFGAVVDVTERRRLEDQFRQAQKMEAIGQLAGGVAHDFNNLLTVILGYSEVLLSKLPANDPIHSSLQTIHQAGERATALTRQLLAFSRRSVLEPRVLDLNTVVADMEKMLRRLIGEDILLSTRLAPGLARVKVDPGQVGQVLMNLAVNARDAMPRGGKLTISTSASAPSSTSVDEEGKGHSVLLKVSDTGHGMTEEVKAHLFEPFFTTKVAGKGTGLGLAVVHGIVQQSGGFIEVDSVPEAGTTFTIYFPAITQPASSLREPREVRRHGTETVLVVEDDDDVRRFALGVLESLGYTVLGAREGAEALRIIDGHHSPIDLLVADVVMPNVDGHDLAAALRRRFPGMKVLYSSGHTDEAIRHGLLHEQVAFLQKPYTPVTLAARVGEVLDGK